MNIAGINRPLLFFVCVDFKSLRLSIIIYVLLACINNAGLL